MLAVLVTQFVRNAKRVTVSGVPKRL